ncbi:MAG: hypothetical protein Q9228_002405 [Teloschistes exilis]
MSFLTSRAFRSIPRTTASIPIRRSNININTRASFHISACRAALSESDHSERSRDSPFHTPTLANLQNDDHEDRKAKIDHHKEDQLNKQKEGKGHWKAELSSNSESAIKADRGEIHNAEEDIAALQKETEKVMGKDEGNKPK